MKLANLSTLERFFTIAHESRTSQIWVPKPEWGARLRMRKGERIVSVKRWKDGGKIETRICQGR